LALAVQHMHRLSCMQLIYSQLSLNCESSIRSAQLACMPIGQRNVASSTVHQSMYMQLASHVLWCLRTCKQVCRRTTLAEMANTKAWVQSVIDGEHLLILL